MKRAVLFLTVMAIMAAVFISGTLPTPSLANKTNPPPPPRVLVGDKKFKTNTVDGESFVRHMRHLRQRNKGVARAMRQLEQRGYKAAGDKGLSLLATDVSEVARFNLKTFRNASLQEETFVDGDYEITFIPYDNGNPAQWVGVVYLLNPISSYTYIYTLDISTSTPEVVEESFIYEDVYVEPDPVNGRYPIIQASMRDGGPACERYSTGKCPPPANLRPFLKCTAAGCAAASTACLLSGPGWAHCTGAWCAGAAVGCLVGGLFS